MKKTKPLKKSLSLSFETVRSLQNNMLGAVVGGSTSVEPSCPGYCSTSTCDHPK